MKKFKFRLHKVLEYRRQKQKEKEQELALQNSRLFSEEQKLKAVLTEQDEAKFIKQGAQTMAEMNLEAAYQQHLMDLLEKQRELVEEATDAVTEARDAYIEKSVEAEMLETLKERKREEFEEEQIRAEKKRLSDLSSQRHRLKKPTDGE